MKAEPEVVQALARLFNFPEFQVFRNWLGKESAAEVQRALYEPDAHLAAVRCGRAQFISELGDLVNTSPDLARKLERRT